MGKQVSSGQATGTHFTLGVGFYEACVSAPIPAQGVVIKRGGYFPVDMVQLSFGAVRRQVSDYPALSLLARLEDRESDVAMDIARSLSRALAHRGSTDIVLDEGDRAELRSVLDEWSLEGELPDELRRLHMALWGERLPWEMLSQARTGLGSPGLGEASRTPFRRR